MRINPSAKKVAMQLAVQETRMTANKVSRSRKAPKDEDTETLRRWTENAVFMLRRVLVIAGGQDLLTLDELTSLNIQICAIDAILVRAFPARVQESTSQACLPF